MVDILREKVSGNKNRYRDEKYNLDLSYITPRLIAMAFPGEGFQSLYRNNAKTVKEFIKEKHKDFLIINISGKKYDYSIFDNKVSEYNWIDHQAPKLNLLFQICKQLYENLIKDSDIVAIINCKAGKGRTGTIICCFLLFSGMFNDPIKAMEFYSIKRFKSGEGVTQPSQKRYIHLFHEVLIRNIYYPLNITLKEISIFHIPQLSKKSYSNPFFEIYLDNGTKIHYSSRKKDNSKIFAKPDSDVKISDENFNFLIVGDFTINFYEENENNLIGRISYNTAFLNPNESSIYFELKNIDPDSLIKNKNYDPKFSITVSFY